MTDSAPEEDAQPPIPPVRRSLRVKLMGFAAVVVLFGGGVPTTTLVLRARAAERSRISAQLRQLGSTIAGGGLFAGRDGGVDAAALASFVENAASLRLPLAYVVVLSPTGEVNEATSAVSAAVLRDIDPALADTWNAGGHALVLKQLASSEQRAAEKSLWLKLQDPKGQALGKLRIGMSTREADRRARNALIQSALAVGALLLLVLLVAYVITGRLAKPLQTLAEAMAEVAEGDLSHEVVPLFTGDEVAQVSASFNRMVTGLRQRERLQSTLGRYVSTEVADHLMMGTQDQDQTAETRQVTVLFLDMRDFTSLSERVAAEAVFTLLNAYFAIIVDVVSQHHGVINKFIGDAIMAVWGAPKAIPESELQAVKAAWEIQRRVGTFNWERHQRGELVVNVGIGINTGQAVAGNVGAQSRMEYTVIGHTVNMAQRFESVAGPGQILVSEEVADAVVGHCETRRLPATRLKGRSDAVVLCEIIRVEEGAPSEGPVGR